MSELDRTNPPSRESQPDFPEFEAVHRRDPRRASAEASQHVFGFAGEFDPHVGSPLSMSLEQGMSRVRVAIRSGNRPLPFDRLQHVVDFVLPSLREVLERPRQKIQREHVLQPIHRVREMDAKCMDWLGRQPGRNVREKLAGRTGALGVQREFSPETEENRLVAKVIRILDPLLEARIAEIDRADFDFRDAGLEFRLRECSQLCRRAIRHSVFGEIDFRAPVRPNNVLLGDRRYSRIWRAWRWLRVMDAQQETAILRSWEGFLTASFWSVVAGVGGSAGVLMSDRPCRFLPGWEEADERFGLMLLSHDEAGANRWTIAAAAGAVIEGDEEVHAGRIAVLTPASAAKPRAGVRDASGRVFGFGPSALDPSIRWQELQIGQELAFRPAAGAEIQIRGAHAASLAADWVGPRRPPRSISVALSGDTIRIGQSVLVGSGLLSADKEQATVIEVSISRDLAGPVERGRGHLMRIRLGESMEISSYADVGGLREISDAVCSLLRLRSATVSTHADRHAVSSAASVGVDLGAALPHAAFAEQAFTVDAGLYLATFPDVCGLDVGTDERRHEFLAGSIRSPCDVLSGGVQVATLSSVLRGGEVPESFSAVFGALARAIDDRITGFPAAGKAFAVPDSVDEFSQSGIRASISGAFGEIAPIWRTAATVLGWQCSSEFLISCVKPNDVVIALDPCCDELAVAVLSARHDAALERAIPGSRGLYWERRPPCTPDDLPGDVAALMRGLTSRDLLSQYFAESLAAAVSQGRLTESEARSAAWLVELGVVERVLAEGARAVVPLGFPMCDYALAIEANRERWEKLLADWAERFAALLPALLGDELFADLLSDARGKTGGVHLLVVGSPYGITAIQADVLTPVKRACDRFGWKLHSLPASSGIAALGAAEFARRRLLRLKAWVDWLPELYLEVVRNGTFVDFELMKEQIAADVAFGRDAVFPIRSALRIPAGKQKVIFPLFEGRSRRRRHDAWIESVSFPLQSPMDASLRLVYRYGQENPYSLEVSPIGRVKAPPIRVQFAPRTQPQSNSPNFPGARGWSDESLSEFVTWLLEQSTRTPDACNSFTTGRWDEVRAGPFHEKLRVRLEVPIRRLWDEGRRASEAPAAIARAASAIRSALMGLAAPGSRTDNDVIRTARMLLARMHADNDQVLLEAIGTAAAGITDPWRRRQYLNMMAYAIGDADGGRANLLAQLSDEVLLSIDAGGRQATHYNAGEEACRGMAIEALSTALWRNSHAVFRLCELRDDFADRFVLGAETLLRVAQRDAGLGIETATKRRAMPRVRSVFQILLALMRLRGTDRIGHVLLAGSPQLTRLSRVGLEADRKLNDAQLPIRSLVRFELDKDAALDRTSDLAYVLRHYLTGDDSCLVHVVGVVDEADA